MPWIAVKTLKHEGTAYEPGDPVPGVEDWPTYRSLKNLNWIEFRDAAPLLSDPVGNGNGHGGAGSPGAAPDQDEEETEPGADPEQQDPQGSAQDDPQAAQADPAGKATEPTKTTGRGRAGGRRPKGAKDGG